MNLRTLGYIYFIYDYVCITCPCYYLNYLQVTYKINEISENKGPNYIKNKTLTYSDLDPRKADPGLNHKERS